MAWPMCVGRLVPDSPAELCSKLRIGDRIVGVNNQPVAGLTHSEVVAAIKRAGLRVVLQLDNSSGGKWTCNMSRITTPIRR